VSQFALCACADALADAQLALDDEDANEIGVAVGTGMGGAQSTDDGYQRVYEQHSDRVQPFSVLLAMNNAAASWIGIEHGLRGARLHAEVAGDGLATDIEHITRPSIAGQAKAMALALASAELAPSDVGYINAHGTGTNAC
jgi:3-oxoacyl-[acyl-carrier-protein] synthase II